MRVLLLTALVAGAYATTGYADWDAAYDADVTADKPALVAAADAAQVTYDTLLTTQFAAFATALSKNDGATPPVATPDFAAAKTAIAAIVTGCKAWQTAVTAWPAALTAAQKTALNTAGKAAFAISSANYAGTCVTTAAAADVPTSPESAWKVTCEAAAGGVWSPSATNADDSAAQWDLMVAEFGDDWTAADGCDKAFGKTGSMWTNVDIVGLVTADAKKGLWPDATTPAPSGSDSDASPAAALAAGVAAIALLF